MHKGSNFSMSSPTLVIFCFDNSHPNGCEVVSHCGFDLTGDVEHLLVLFGHLCISFGECLFRSFAHLWIGLFVFCCWVVGVLYIFWISFFTRYMLCKYFLPFCGLPFHSVDSVLWCTKAFKFDEVQFICFFFCCLCFCCCTQEIIAKYNVMKLPPVSF